MPQLQPNSDFGSYQIVRHIGGGGMAQIYLVKTKGVAGFEKFLALKVINSEYATEPRFIQMLVDEAKIVVELTHVNIAQVFDLSEQDGVYYMAMEYVDGVDVLGLVNGLHSLGHRVPIEAVAYIGRQICAGLHYAHTKRDKQGAPLNIVHRDISPQNILVSRAGEVKLVDFGIAKAASVSTRTQAGVIKGKVNYMAPEQAQGHFASPRSDIFAVGVVCWEMLTSQMVYPGDKGDALLSKVRKAAIPAPSTVRPEVPAALDALIMRALRPKPEERFATAQEFQIELTKFLSATTADYSGANLALVVEQVMDRRTPSSHSVDSAGTPFSREDQLSVGNRNSLIFVPTHERPRLVVRDGDDQFVFPIQEDEVSLGRAGSIAIADPRVSRHHAKIRRIGAAYQVEDVGSSNGTFVNDQRIKGPFRLRGGDVVRLGSCLIRFEVGFGSSPSTAPAAHRPDRPEERLQLVLSAGKRRIERPLGRELSLAYRVQIGGIELHGTAGRVQQHDGKVWFAPYAGPTGGPTSLGERGTTTPSAIALSDRPHQVAGVSLTVETTEFSADS